MADTTYRVVVKYDLESKQAESGIDALIARAEKSATAFKASKSAMEQLTEHANKTAAQAFRSASGGAGGGNHGWFNQLVLDTSRSAKAADEARKAFQPLAKEVEHGAQGLAKWHEESKHFMTGLGIGVLIEGFNILKEVIQSAIEGVIEFAHHLIEAGERAEKARFGISAMVNAAGFKGVNNFNESLKISETIMEELRTTAAKLPGTFEDIQQIFQTLVMPGKEAGRSMRDIIDLSGKTMALGNLLHIGGDTAAHGVMRILAGQARSIDPLFMRIRGTMSEIAGREIDTTELGAMSKPERYELLLKTLEKFREPIEKYGDSWGAVSTTFKSHVQEVEEFVAQGFFEGLTDTVKGLNDWFKENRKEILEIAKTVGNALAQAFKFVRDIVQGLIEDINDLFFQLSKLGKMRDGPFSGASSYNAMDLRDYMDLIKRMRRQRDAMAGKNQEKTETDKLLSAAQPVVNQHTTNNNNVVINQRLENADNPNTVLVATKQALLDALHRPVESPGAPSVAYRFNP